MNVYESIPTMEKGEIRLRPVTAADEAALLRVYGDPLSLPFFNSDNCHGDIFYYDTPEKMRRAMDFWRTSWEQGWFVRWAIALRSEVIGTVELCRRGESPDDPYSGMGILRVDVGSAWEKSDVLAAVMDALLPDAYALLNCRTLMTKAAPYAVARVATLTECGFERQAGDGTPWGKVRVLLGQGKVRRIEKRGAQVDEDLCAARLWGMKVERKVHELKNFR